jgi:methylated-DNA-[protein]-cysteine S-methyltransferase
MTPALAFQYTDTPLGLVLIEANDLGVRAVSFDPGPMHREGSPSAVSRRLASEAAAQLASYFAGDRLAFDVPLSLPGTPFQQRVWAALREIPAGTTLSYSQLAQRLGDPLAVRAVGMANGANPVAIIVPCHRVIGAGGELRGYAAGVARKRWLLDHEAARSPASLFARA